jgi:orotate phosphoribosyltransferase
MSLAKRIQALCQLTGNFTLRSGRTATEYFDKYFFEADPQLLFDITKRLAAFIPSGTEVLAGLEMGGIAIVTMLSQHSGLPAVFVRKAPKQYGTAKLCEGASIAGRTVLIVEDVVTSGGQVVLSTGGLRALGAQIDCALCVIDREEGGGEALAKEGVTLLSLLKRRDFVGL